MFIYHFNRMIRSKILWLIFAIVVGATFLALPSCFTGDASGRNYAGTLGREKISQDEYGLAEMFVQRFMRLGDLPPAVTETQIWAHIAAMHAAKKMGITVSPEELRSILRSEPSFQQDGQFSPYLYKSLVEQSLGVTVAGYERLLSDQIVLNKLMQAVASGNLASPMEVEDEVAARTDTISFMYASVSNKFATADIEVSSDEVKAYFEEHKADYALPDRVAVSYAALPVTNYFASVVIDDIDLEDYYDSNPSQYSREGTNGVEQIPFEEVRDQIWNELAYSEAASIALTNLNDFIESLYTNDTATFTLRCQARGMKTGATQLFPLEGAYLPGIEREALQDFRETAHDLDSTRGDSRYGVAQGKQFVYLICATTNDAAHTPSFESLESSIRPLAVAASRQKKFISFAEETAAALTGAMKDNGSFADAAKAQSLNVSTSITFKASETDFSAFDNARALIPEVARLKVGQISKPIEIYNGALLACVSERKPALAVETAVQREQLRSMLSSMNGAAAFSDWMIWNLERIGFTSTKAAIWETAAAEGTADEEEE